MCFGGWVTAWGVVDKYAQCLVSANCVWVNVGGGVISTRSFW